jgi:hypothetical protein
MYNQTRQNLTSFDNPHEFERLSTDILNSLGYENVEPMAPLGGTDGGIDVKYSNGEAKGIAFATLRKDIRIKFIEDLGKQETIPDEISLFCNVDITPKMKAEFTGKASERGASIEIYDLERIRSLFDSSLRNLRRKYLGIDDDISMTIKDKIAKLIRYRNASIIEYKAQTILEKMLLDKLPHDLFHLLMEFSLNDIKEVPRIGPRFDDFLNRYDSFLGSLKRNENDIIERIGQLAGTDLKASWTINYEYSILRFSGMDIEKIKRTGLFLNYGITWESAEKIYLKIKDDLEAIIHPNIEEYGSLCEFCRNISN